MRCHPFIRISRIVLAAAVLLLGAVGILYQPANAQQTRVSNGAALLEIKGAIGPAVQDFVRRGIRQAVKKGDRVIILRMDTPGGLSKSMREIIKDILSSPIPVITYVAPSGARAASAGTYILYASHVAAMAPGTNLGAATPVAIGNPAGGKGKDKDKDKKKAKSASEMKAINDARAYIRSLAQLRGRNVKWAEAAVTKAESLSAEEALKQNVINIVAKNITDLLKQANGMKVSVQGQTRVLNTQNLTIQVIKPDWRTRLLSVITNPSVAYILLMIGIYGIFFEFVNPGFIIPGVTGAICLLLAMYAFQLLPINYAGLGLIILGIIFIIAEAFMPSFGALGIGGIISFVVGSIMLLRTDVAGYGLPWHVIGAITFVTVGFFVLMMQLIFRSRRKHVVSGAEGMLDQTGVIKERNGQLALLVGGEFWKFHCDEPVQAGDHVVVNAVDGLVLQVTKIANSEEG